MSSSVPDQDAVVLCSGPNNEHDGCTRLFPLRDQSQDLCNKCQALDAAKSPADKAEAEVRNLLDCRTSIDLNVALTTM